jgi:hypothetical protein
MTQRMRICGDVLVALLEVEFGFVYQTGMLLREICQYIKDYAL